MVAVRAGLLASRVRTCKDEVLPRSYRPSITTGLPRAYRTSGRLQISSLTVARQRGILTRFPLLIVMMRTREPKSFERAKRKVSKIYSGFLRHVNCAFCGGDVTLLV